MPETFDLEPRIDTRRLRLVPVVGSDAQEMFPILGDLKLYQFTGGEPPESVRALESWYQNLESRTSADGAQLWLTWIVRLAESGSAIGYVQATIQASHVDIAWLIGTNWQGRGFASEAAVALVAWLGDNEVNVVRACVRPDHSASQRVAANAGLALSDLTEDGEDVWTL